MATEGRLCWPRITAGTRNFTFRLPQRTHPVSYTLDVSAAARYAVFNRMLAPEGES